jgi:lincosamide nucleotidyltransferase A/C/D/E
MSDEQMTDFAAVPGATDAAEVRAVLDALDSAGCPAWLEGGWGVDALAGRQTRPHRDLDIAIDASQESLVLATLDRLGYTIETDWRPTRVELVAPGRGWVDVHPVVLDSAGDGVQTGLDGETYRYPAAGFTTGTVAGRTVGCISVEQQIAWRSGFALRAVDHHDLAVLHQLLAARQPADGAMEDADG